VTECVGDSRVARRVSAARRSRPSRAIVASSIGVSAGAAHVYSECARIWNPIHTDLAVARAAGLPEPILHGTATLALAVSEVLRLDLGGDPTRVGEIAARFTGMVTLPSSVTVREHGRAGDLLAFDVVNERGEPVLSDGVLRSAP